MTNSKEVSDLSLSRKECPKCGAVWINGQHYWSGTGNKGNELDLAGLVCNKLGDDQCINPVRGQDGCLLYTSPSPRDATLSRMPSSA